MVSGNFAGYQFALEYRAFNHMSFFVTEVVAFGLSSNYSVANFPLFFLQLARGTDPPNFSEDSKVALRLLAVGCNRR